MQVAKISPLNALYSAQNIKQRNNLPFLGLSEDSFVCQDFKYENYKRALEKAKGTPSLVLRHASGDLLDKLEGLQYGLKTFEGASIKEIYHILKKGGSLELALTRGCTNGCKHCYVGARPPIQNDNTHISKMSYENFLQFTEDFVQMKDRLKFSYPNSYVTFFRDSDCKDIYLKDLSGKEHPYQEISKIFYEKTGIRNVFDTAGWSTSDAATQKRMEELVEYYAKDNNMNEIYSMSISLNPFGNLMSYANDLAQLGKTEESQKVREKYVKNMANAFFTFTPLVKNKKFSVIGLSLPYSANKPQEEGYNEQSYYKLARDILKELEKMYQLDFEGEQRVIKKRGQIKSNLEEIKSLCLPPKTKIGKSGHDSGFYYNQENPRYTHSDIKNLFNVFIDTNGEVYLTKMTDCYKTPTHLNFEDKEKQTSPVRPESKDTIDMAKFYK